MPNFSSDMNNENNLTAHTQPFALRVLRIIAWSCAEFIAKIGIVEEEADELTAILAASRLTAVRHR